MINFQPNNKFAIIAINNIAVKDTIHDPIFLCSNFIASQKWDASLNEKWIEALGSLKINQISKASLYVACTKESNNPNIFDAENQELLYRVGKFHHAMLIVVPGAIRGTSIRLSGANVDGYVSIRHVETYRQPIWVPGTPVSVINEQTLRSIAILANQIETFEKACRGLRVKKALMCFLEGTFLEFADAKLHQYVRCIEGFILPEKGKTKKQFKSRTELFVGLGHHELMGELYNIRSCAEHLNNTLSVIHGKSEADRIKTLYRLCYCAESLAAYCLRRFFEHSQLWKYFDNDESIKEFWKLNDKQRQELWGESIDLQLIENTFDDSMISDINLRYY